MLQRLLFITLTLSLGLRGSTFLPAVTTVRCRLFARIPLPLHLTWDSNSQPSADSQSSEVAGNDQRLVLSINNQKNEADKLYVGLLRQSTMDDLKPDHAVAVFKRNANDDDFQVDSILCIVELKLQGATGASELEFDEITDKIRRPDLYARNSVLSQVILYVFRQVYPGLCSFGLRTSTFPLTVVVGKNNAKDNGKGELRWCRGELVVPTSCCDNFVYRISNFGLFGNKARAYDEDNVVNLGAAAYCDAMFFGLDAALTAVDATKKGPVRCTPLSGQQLIVGRERKNFSGREDIVADVQLYPGPLNILATAGNTSRHRGSIAVSQADLFEGVIPGATLSSMRDEAPRPFRSCFWFDKPDSTKDYNVIVKASSSTVHPQSVSSIATFSALKSIQNVESESFKRQLSRVLLAIYRSSVGSISIMHDLRKENFKVLLTSEKNSSGQRLYPLNYLWAAYRALVLEMLLPMARNELVHSDIRPGSDVTANILVMQHFDEYSTLQSLEMALIDLESIVEKENLSIEIDGDGRYVQTDAARNAVEYLWWQSLTLAYTWGDRINQTTLQTSKHGILEGFVDSLKTAAKADYSGAHAVGAGETPDNFVVDDRFEGETLEHDGTATPVDKTGQTITSVDFKSWLLQDKIFMELLRSETFEQESDSIEIMLDRIAVYFDQYSG